MQANLKVYRFDPQKDCKPRYQTYRVETTRQLI
jgi:succinate dehydrogenase/fumarate reductase-like Fe-S protein